MQILIVGGGGTGVELARDLSVEHAVTVIDSDRDVIGRLQALDVAAVLGNGTSPETLSMAGAGAADLLIACTGLDEVNMVACALAAGLGVRRTFCFVSREDLDGTGANGEAVRRHFGIERIIWPEAQLAEEIFRIVCAPGAIDAEEFADGRVRLLEFRVGADAPITAAPLASLGLPRSALVVAVKRQNAVEIPRGTTRLTAGDKVFVMGTPEAMTAMLPLVKPGSVGRSSQSVTIIGGGDVGLRLAGRLDDAGMAVRIIEHDLQRGEILAARLPNALVIHGDGTDLELLESEQVGQSDVLVSVIDNDARNLFASLMGRQLGVRRTITRVGRPANLRLFERVGIDVALSARGAAVKALVHSVRGGHAQLLAVLEEGLATIVEVSVPPGFTPIALHQLQVPCAIVGAIVRNGDVLVPRGADMIRPGDSLIVFVAADSVHAVRDYFARS